MSTTTTHGGRSTEIERLLAPLREAAVTVFGGSRVFLAYAYGSRIWGVPRAGSDLDVGYYLFPKGEPRCLDLADELHFAGLLSDAAGVEVDLRCLTQAPLELRGRVLAEGRRIYCSDEVARVNLERDLLSRYLDYKPKLEALRRLRFASLAARSR